MPPYFSQELEQSLGGLIQVQHVQNDTDAAIAQKCAAVDAVFLDVKAVEIAGQLLDHNLLFSQQFIHKQAVRAFTGFQPHDNKQLVLDRVPGMSANSIRIKQDWDDGRLVYEGEAWHNGTEYEFEIDASTGRFLDWSEEPFWD